MGYFSCVEEMAGQYFESDVKETYKVERSRECITGEFSLAGSCLFHWAPLWIFANLPQVLKKKKVAKGVGGKQEKS